MAGDEAGEEKEQRLLAGAPAEPAKLPDMRPAEEALEALRRALAEEQQRAEDYLSRLKYLQADFENYRKRVEREVSEVYQLGNERLITNLLSVLDELELAVRVGEKARGKEAVVTGVRMVLKKMYDMLEREGLAKIEAMGKPFDPGKHEVVSTVVAEGRGEGLIVEEVRKGFTLRGKVIRPSMVKIVARAPSTDRSSEVGKAQ